MDESYLNISLEEWCENSLSPNNSTNQQNLVFVSGLVKMSAGFSSVGTYLTCNFPVFDSFSDEVIFYIDVLGLSMEFVVLWQHNFPLIVTIKRDQII